MAATGSGTREVGSSAYGSPTQKVKDDADAIRRDIASLADTVSKLASEKIGAASNDIQASAELKLESLESSIRKNPTQSALIAIGVGFLFGLVLTR
jgi:ElaB/YqjD/DUF883 family membrane-anchored ribosome-binding protein